MSICLQCGYGRGLMPGVLAVTAKGEPVLCACGGSSRVHCCEGERCQPETAGWGSPSSDPPSNTTLEARVDRIERLLALLYTEPLEAGWVYSMKIRAITREIAKERALRRGALPA
jgi:hypothetical protein